MSMQDERWCNAVANLSHVRAQFVTFCIDHDIDLVILPSHTSHVTHPLDVSVFGTLKRAIATEKDLLQRYQVNCRQKAEWVAALARARGKAMSTENIQSGFKSAAIHPFNPSKFLWLHSTASSTPVAQSDSGVTPSRRTPLCSLADENRAFIQDNPTMNTPVKRQLCAASNSLEAAHTKVFLLEQELSPIKSFTAAQKRPRGGISVRNLGTHVFSTETVFRLIQGYEEAVKARKLGLRRPRQASSSPDPLEGGVFM